MLPPKHPDRIAGAPPAALGRRNLVNLLLRTLQRLHALGDSALRALRSERRRADLQSTCCALELSLKSVILQAGGIDEQNRVEIRHDLVKALEAASADGFFTPPELASIAAGLSPYYQTHSLDSLAKQMNEGDLAKIIATAARLVATTRADQV